MKAKGWLPTVPEVAREAIIVVAGAIVAAAVVGAIPRLRTWLREQWEKKP